MTKTYKLRGEAGTTIVHNRAELADWLAANAPHLDLNEIEAGVTAVASGGGPEAHKNALPTYPMQARYVPENGLVRDANGNGIINPNATAYRTYGSTNRMWLETRS